MSELTTPIMIDIPGVGSIESADLYLKSEADKIISELKDKARHYPMMVLIIEEAKRDLLRQAKEIRHHKYKRCLAMSERCKDKIENAVQYNEHDDWLIINEYWERWHKRWQELAEKFKSEEAR